MQRSFKKLNLNTDLLKNLDLLGFHQMTNIQSKALSTILEGKDVIAEAQTGSGKTVAFGLGLLSQIVTADFCVQSLVLCPTRELATQVATEIRRLARMTPNLKVLTLCGGTPIQPQMDSLDRGAHVVVGTPGRIVDHLKKKNLDLTEVNTFVLDEADRMLDMGFEEDIHFIMKRSPRNKQTLLFSATFPDNIAKVSRRIQRDPQHIVGESEIQNSDIEQFFFETKKDEKDAVLLAILQQFKPESSIVFCTTKIQCAEVSRRLRESGVVALALHGDLEQDERHEVMVRFANGSASVLVATDVAARGLDINNLSAVINFELSKDPEVHVHRIGRTGRAGNKGIALSMYNRSEVFRIKAIEKLINKDLPRESKLKRTQQKKIDLKPVMQTLKIFAGKKSKLRPGDILGALTKEAQIENQFIGKINIFDNISYVAIHKKHIENAVRHLAAAKIKNRNFRLKVLWSSK